MDLSRPRKLRLGCTQTFFKAWMLDGTLYIDANGKRPSAILDALGTPVGRVFGAQGTWRRPVAEALQAGAPVVWVMPAPAAARAERARRLPPSVECTECACESPRVCRTMTSAEYECPGCANQFSVSA